MKKTSFNTGWTIQRGEPSNIPMMPAQTRPVTLPHDFMIEGDMDKNSRNGPNTGYFSGGTFTYTKMIDTPAEWADRRVLVYFDGMFGETSVSLNVGVVGTHRYGYTPFTAGLTERLVCGAPNRLSVTVSNDKEHNSRWYSGGGIYRDVTLLTAPRVHIAPDGIYLHTGHIIDDAFVIA